MTEPLQLVDDGLTVNVAVFATSAAQVLLTPSLAAFLASAAADGRRPVLVTDAGASLSSLLTIALGRVGAAWAARVDGELFHATAGRRLGSLADLWQDTGETARLPGFDVPTPGVAVLMVEAYVPHRVSGRVPVGRTVEEIVERLGGAPLERSGRAEPLTERFDGPMVTEATRRTMPDSDVIYARSGDGSFAVTSARRTRNGILQSIKVGVPVGPAREMFGACTERGSDVLNWLQSQHNAAFAMASVAEFDSDVTRSPRARRREQPLVALFGPTAVSTFGSDLAALAARHRGTTLGRTLTPSMLFRFSPGNPSPWVRFLELAAELGPERLAEAMSPPGASHRVAAIQNNQQQASLVGGR